jgi:hypothetical protein
MSDLMKKETEIGENLVPQSNENPNVSKFIDDSINQINDNQVPSVELSEKIFDKIKNLS